MNILLFQNEFLNEMNSLFRIEGVGRIENEDLGREFYTEITSI